MMLGHNNPPADFTRVDELVSNADRWTAERPTIETPEIAEKAQAFLAQLRECAKAIEDQRKAEKEPHLEAGREVDAKFKPQVDRLKGAADAIKGMLTKYLQKIEAERRAEEVRLRQEAEEAARKAAEANAATIDGKLQAEQAQQEAADRQAEADRMAKQSAKISGSYGGRAVSLRTVRVGVIVDQGKVYRKFKDHPSVVAALQKLVDAEVKAKRTVPGVEVQENQQAA